MTIFQNLRHLRILYNYYIHKLYNKNRYKSEIKQILSLLEDLNYVIPFKFLVYNNLYSMFYYTTTIQDVLNV